MKIGVKESVKKILARSTLAGHVERMGDEKLAKRADAQKVEGKWRRGRPKLRCIISVGLGRNILHRHRYTLCTL